MRDFVDLARRALRDCGYSMSAASRAINYDLSYLSRVLNRKQAPSLQLAETLDRLLGTGDQLASLVAPDKAPAPSEEPPGIESDVAFMKASIMNLLQHADRYGGDAVAPAAVQVWRSAQHKLDTGSVPEKEQRAYLAATAEAAEVAGWLLFDAAQWDAARTAFLESHMLARHAGDRSMQWFALDMLAMLDIERGRPAEALRIADELASGHRIPPRVALLTQIRRGRGLAQVGDQKRAMSNLDAARGRAEESLSPRDPAWAWWVDSTETRWHTGAAMRDLGDHEDAATIIHGAIERASLPDGRSALHLRIGLLSAFTSAKAWSEAETELESIASLLPSVHSGRNRGMLRGVLDTIGREPRAPIGLADLAKETAAAIAA